MTGARQLDDDGDVWAFDLGSVNAFLVDDGEVTLVDAGTPGAVDDLRAGIDEAGYAVDDLDRVLVTHYDLDHVGGLGGLDPDAPVYAMEPDASLLDGSRRPPLSNKKGFFQRVAGVVFSIPEIPAERVADGDQVGGFTAYHTPGHTPGHTAYHHPELGVALVGDLVSESDGELGTPAWPLAYDNGQNRESIRALADRDLGFDVLCMGHGDPITTDGAGVLARLAAEL